MSMLRSIPKTDRTKFNKQKSPRLQCRGLLLFVLDCNGWGREARGCLPLNTPTSFWKSLTKTFDFPNYFLSGLI